MHCCIMSVTGDSGASSPAKAEGWNKTVELVYLEKLFKVHSLKCIDHSCTLTACHAGEWGRKTSGVCGSACIIAISHHSIQTQARCLQQKVPSFGKAITTAGKVAETWNLQQQSFHSYCLQPPRPCGLIILKLIQAPAYNHIKPTPIHQSGRKSTNLSTTLNRT